MRIIAACILVSILPSFATAADVDWKLYGTASVERASVCFYEAKGITRAPDRRLRVWTKCLLQKDLDSVDIKNEFGGKILENATRKFLNTYVPPIGLVEDMNADQAVIVMQYEETANLSNIQPHARFFYELNCPERLIRRLSTYVRAANGKEGFSDKPSGWVHVPPEGSAATLLKILCR